jgi:hypothetical protein
MKKIVLMSLTLIALVVIMFKAITAAAGISGGDLPDKEINPVAVVQAAADETAQSAKAEILNAQGEAKDALEQDDEDARDLKALRDQMNKERGIQQQIKLHNLELERTKVQLEQEKALAEMNQLRKTNLGIVRDPNGNGTVALPDIKLIFLSSSEKVREAILTINGTNYTVKEGDKPLDNILVKTIKEKGALIVVNGEKEILLTTNLME